MNESLVVAEQAPAAVVVVPADPVRVVVDRLQPVLLREEGDTACVARADAPTPPVVVHPAPAPQVVATGFVGPRGPQGPQGDPGGAGVLARPIGAVVQGLRIVRAVDGVIYPVDVADETHAAEVAGLSLQSVTVIGTDVNVQLAGPVTDSSWVWSPGVVWCGADGALTQTPLATGWLLQVGRVIGPDTIDIDILQPILRS